jgi:hypothetical protein
MSPNSHPAAQTALPRSPFGDVFEYGVDAGAGGHGLAQASLLRPCLDRRISDGVVGPRDFDATLGVQRIGAPVLSLLLQLGFEERRWK